VEDTCIECTWETGLLALSSLPPQSTLVLKKHWMRKNDNDEDIINDTYFMIIRQVAQAVRQLYKLSCGFCMLHFADSWLSIGFPKGSSFIYLTLQHYFEHVLSL
jgi:hypothetical protein